MTREKPRLPKSTQRGSALCALAIEGEELDEINMRESMSMRWAASLELDMSTRTRLLEEIKVCKRDQAASSTRGLQETNTRRYSTYGLTMPRSSTSDTLLGN